MTKVQMETARGASIRDQIRLIRNMYQGDDESFIESLQPVMTQVNPADENDLDEFKTNLEDAFSEEVKAELAKAKQNQDGTDEEQINQIKN